MDDLNVKERMLDNILNYFSGQFFSQRVAAKIVGGHERLKTLIESGEISVLDPVAARNGKWRIRADQVLRHCKIRH